MTHLKKMNTISKVAGKKRVFFEKDLLNRDNGYGYRQKEVNMQKTVLDNSKRRIDDSWNFKEANTKEHTHGFHTYPAMMIPQIARRLIKEYGNNPKCIVDPFMGSGSSIVESMLNDSTKKIFGIEINPLAILIAKVKSTPLNPKTLSKEYCNLTKDFKSVVAEKPDFFNIDFWFKPEVIEDLAKLKASIKKIKNQDIQDFFKVCFSETVRLVSNTRNGEFKLYRMPEEKLKKFNPDTLKVFNGVYNKNLSRMEGFYENLKEKKVDINILKEDTREKTAILNEECDFLVTSPPYGDSRTTVAYGQFSRLSSQWLDFDYEEVKNVDKKGLGGIPTKDLIHNLNSTSLKKIINKISKEDKKRTKDVLAFYADFSKCTEEIDRIMKKDSHLCFVVGNRTVKGINIPTDKIIAEMFANNFGYKHIETIVREIPSKRMPKANSPTNEKGKTLSTMNHEYIVVLKK